MIDKKTNEEIPSALEYIEIINDHNSEGNN